MIEYFGVHVGYQQIYGTKLPLDEAVSRLRRYPLEPLLGVLARIDAALSLTSLDEFAKGHRLITNWILTPSQREDIAKFWRTQKRDQGRGHNLILFHELQVLNAVKLALLNCDEEVNSSPDDFGPLVDALLILNDHLTPLQIWPENFDKLTVEEQREVMVRYFVPGMVFHRGTTTLHFLSRWHDLFFVDAPSLQQHQDYMDLSAILAKLIGLDAMLFYWIGTAFFTFWMALTTENIDTASVVLSLQASLRNFDIRIEEYEPVLRQFASTRDELRTQFQERSGWEPYFLLPMQARPLLRRGDLIFCLSRRFTAEKISSGLYHLILTELPTKEERDRFLRFFGHVFESYVNRLFGRVFPPTDLAQRHYPAERDPNTGNEIADAILDYGDALVLIEAKATLFSLPILVSADQNLLEQKFQDIVYDSAAQLQRAISAIKTGLLAHRGVTRDRIKGYFPVVVTLQFIPLEPLTYRKFQDGLADMQLLQAGDVAPLQIVSVEDLERLETAMTSGETFVGLLRHKVADQRLRQMTFGNFLYERVPRIVKPHNQYLQERFKVITDELMNFIKERQRPG